MDPPKARSDFKEKKQKSPGILPGIVGKGTEIPATAFNFHHGGLQLPQTHREEEQIHRSQRGTRLVFLDAVGDAASEVGLELNDTNGLVFRCIQGGTLLPIRNMLLDCILDFE